MHRILKEELNFIPRDMKTELCKCNNCDSILIDQNPQIGAKELDTKDYPTIKQMMWKDDHWVCCVCKTDEFLIDL